MSNKEPANKIYTKAAGTEASASNWPQHLIAILNPSTEGILWASSQRHDLLYSERSVETFRNLDFY